MAAISSVSSPALPNFTMQITEVGGKIGPQGVVKVTAANEDTKMKLYRIMQDHLSHGFNRLCIYDRVYVGTGEDKCSVNLRVDLDLHNRGVTATVIFNTLLQWQKVGYATKFDFNSLDSIMKLAKAKAKVEEARQALERAEKELAVLEAAASSTSTTSSSQ